MDPEFYVPEHAAVAIYGDDGGHTVPVGRDDEARALSVPAAVTIAIEGVVTLKLAGRAAAAISAALAEGVVPSAELVGRRFMRRFLAGPGNEPRPMNVLGGKSGREVVPLHEIFAGYVVGDASPMLVGTDGVAYEAEPDHPDGPTVSFRGRLPSETLTKLADAAPGGAFKAMPALSATRLEDAALDALLARGPFHAVIGGDW